MLRCWMGNQVSLPAASPHLRPPQAREVGGVVWSQPGAALRMQREVRPKVGKRTTPNQLGLCSGCHVSWSRVAHMARPKSTASTAGPQITLFIITPTRNKSFSGQGHCLGGAAHSPHVCVGFPRGLRLPPTSQRDTL